jgi:rifampicin phosphotransferase
MIFEKEISKKEGGKAYNLSILLKKGFYVPEFWVISNKVLGSISEEMIAKEIWKKIENKGQFILRSSARGEDGLRNSFAGIFDSYKINSYETTLRAIRKIKKTPKSNKLKSYLKTKKISIEPKMNIVLQRYILGEVSGVAFVEKESIVLNAKRGTNEEVVEGRNSKEFSFKKNKEIFGRKFLLPKKKTKELLKILIGVSKKMGKPQDIEWTFKGGKIYILQTRDITQKIGQELLVWDNSNLVESYPGVVLPLTESFITELYKEVYRKLAQKSGVSMKKIESYEKEFNQLIGSFKGHLYYNMLNWYKMFTLFPGYSRNKKNFDRMITARSKAKLNTEYHKNVSMMFKLKYYPHIFYKYLKLDKTIDYFERETKIIINDLPEEKIDKLEYSECLKIYNELRRKLVNLWYIPIENDFIAMTFNGLLEDYFKRKRIPQEELLKILGGIDNLHTSNQINKLKEISVLINKISKKQIKNAKDIKNSIEENPEILELIEYYFKEFGGRFAEELKLESHEVKKDSVEFYNVLNSYSNILPILKKQETKMILPKIQNYYLSKTKKHLMKREEMRILRAQVFNLGRRVFLRMGQILAQRNLIENDRDIFYLKTSELRNKEDKRELIKKRKNIYAKYKKEDMPQIIYTDEDKKIVSVEDEEINSKEKLCGRPCSLGFVKAKANIINSIPRLNKNYGIIIAKTADPGWAPVLPLCKGLIIENGGLLSHISILARELGIPCIIEAKGATKLIKEGEVISMDGRNGKIDIN